jgi:hypothetical protein
MVLSEIAILMLTIAMATGLPVQAPRPPESRLSKLLRIGGLTAAPSQMRGPADDIAAGDIWIVDVDRRVARALTSEGGYRSPIFLPGDLTLLALRANTIVRLSSQGGNAIPVQNVRGVVKLVGVDAANPAEVVVLLDAPEPESPLAAVSLQNGTMTALPFDGSSEQQRRVLTQIRAQDRTYGETAIYTKTESKPGLPRPIEWVDVFLRRGTTSPQNVSACDGVNCVQPALSPDGRSVAFVKAQD